MKFLTTLSIVLVLPAVAFAQPRPVCIRVEARDAGTPISGARLTTTGRLVVTTDVNGNAAFYEPGLMDQSVFFTPTHPVPLVRVGRWITDSNGLIAFYERPAFGVPARYEVFSHGYDFGDGGVLLTPTPGGTAELRLTRRNVAERVQRVTGGGIYADTVLLGGDGGVLNAGVIGQRMSYSRTSVCMIGGMCTNEIDALRPMKPLASSIASLSVSVRSQPSSEGTWLFSAPAQMIFPHHCRPFSPQYHM